MHLARDLIQYGDAAAGSRHSPRIQFPLQNSKNDDSSEDELYESQVKQSRKVVPQAVPEVRFDQVGHLNTKMTVLLQNVGIQAASPDQE